MSDLQTNVLYYGDNLEVPRRFIPDASVNAIYLDPLLSYRVDQAELNDHGVILEYQLGNASRRLDAMLTGHSPTSAENAVVVELKQRSDGSAQSSPDRVPPLGLRAPELHCHAELDEEIGTSDGKREPDNGQARQER